MLKGLKNGTAWCPSEFMAMARGFSIFADSIACPMGPDRCCVIRMNNHKEIIVNNNSNNNNNDNNNDNGFFCCFRCHVTDPSNRQRNLLNIGLEGAKIDYIELADSNGSGVLLGRTVDLRSLARSADDRPDVASASPSLCKSSQ